MAQSSVRCSGSSVGSHYTLTVYGEAFSNSQNRTGYATVYANLKADSGYAFALYTVNVECGFGSTSAGTTTIRSCDSSGVSTQKYTSGTYNYNSDGSLSVTVYANLSCASPEPYAPGSGLVSVTLNFPNIGPSSIVPTCTVGNPVITDTYNGYAIAGKSKIKWPITTSNAASTTAWITTGSRTQGTTVSGGYTSQITVPNGEYDFDITCNAYSTSSTNTKSATSTKTTEILGYHIPRVDSTTYTCRCKADGTPDGLGEYGKLHLEWDVADTLDNAIQSAVVKIDDTTVTPTSGSIAEGYLEYIVAASTASNHPIEIKLTDKIDTNTITSYIISKANMPLSLYDDGTDIGISFGTLATQKGYNFYTNNGQWPVTIDGQPIGSGGGTSIFIHEGLLPDVPPAGMKVGDLLICYINNTTRIGYEEEE